MCPQHCPASDAFLVHAAVYRVKLRQRDVRASGPFLNFTQRSAHSSFEEVWPRFLIQVLFKPDVTTRCDDNELRLEVFGW